MPKPTYVPWMVARRQDRFGARLAVHYRHDATIGNGVITNLSRQGWTVASSNHQLMTGQTVVFRLPFDDPSNQQADTHTVVRWVGANAFGVEVVQPSAATQARLDTWVRVVSNALSWSRIHRIA
ncbi:MAG: PilZ domain-containing protein [Nitrospiraceae bacterium]